MYTKPTGLLIVPPDGPAIPVVEIHSLLSLILCKLINISFATALLTAPYFLIFLDEILKICFLESFEYVISPILKILDIPGTFINIELSNPPVNDSATDSVICFLINLLIVNLYDSISK